MNRYTNEEKADMVFMYGAANGNATNARRLYADRFPNRLTPDTRLFERLFRELRETGSFVSLRTDAGRPRSVRILDQEEAILRHVANNPSTSVRAVAGRVAASTATVHRVIADEELYPYHLQRVQALAPADYGPRVEYCQWFLQKMITQQDLPALVLFTDEAMFTQEGIFNSHNTHYWAHENPHRTRPHAYQTRFSVNVWAGLLGEHLIGPYLIPDRLTGNTYLNFLRHVLPELLQNLPGHLRRRMWFQHDGAPAHFSREVRAFLDTAYGTRWIGRGGPVAWPARSPDLTSLDFFLWGHLKSLVYETPVASRENLVARIVAAAGEIQDNPDILDRVCHSIVRRYNACMRVGGRSFEQLL